MREILMLLNGVYKLIAFIVFGWILLPIMVFTLLKRLGGSDDYDVIHWWHSCVFFFDKYLEVVSE